MGLKQSRQQLSEQLFYGMSWSGSERNCLFLNHGGKSFATASYITGFDFDDDARGIAMVDWDHDGDLDMWVSNRYGPQVRYLENQISDSRWISMKLLGDGKKINRDAVGSTVIVWIEEDGKEVPLKRSVAAGDSFLSQSSLWLNVGLAEATIKRIEIRWPDGSKQELSALKENRQYTLKYGDKDAAVWKRPTNYKLPDTPLEEPVRDHRGIRLVEGSPLPPLGLVDAKGKPAEIPKGKSTLIKFWASWCPDCQNDFKELELYRNYFSQVGVDVVLVNTEFNDDGSLKMAKSPVKGFPSYFMNKAGVDTIQLFLDSISVLHQEMALPLSILVNADGRVNGVYVGHVKPENIARDAICGRRATAWRYMNAVPFQGKMFNNTFMANYDRVATNFQTAGHYKYAASIYQIALPHYPKSAKLHFEYGECLNRLGQMQSAIPLLEKALSLKPDFSEKPDALRALGFAYMQSEQPQKAEKALKESLQISEDKSTHLYLGLLAEGGSLFARAEQHYRQAIALSKQQKPVFKRPWQALYRLYIEQGRNLEADHLRDEASEFGVSW
ncbi:MAG: ASPIC/UnbV domain-containing protein [Akkermansiaceae bacterium]|nr:ASPIC/UnbV domain-containing protein [Akkermansiaceae bacterium]